MRLEHLLSGERPSPCSYRGGNIHWGKALQTKGRDRKLEGSSCRDLSVPERRKRDGVSRKTILRRKKEKRCMKHTALVRQLPQERILDKKHLRKKWDQTDRFFRGNADEGEKERERRHVPVKGIPFEGGDADKQTSQSYSSVG